MTDEITVTRNEEKSRYEIHVGDELGGYLELKPREGGVVGVPHTEIDSAFKGKGLGSKLAGEALADMARRGEAVRPTCPFISHYLRENEVAGLIVDWPDEEDAGDAATPSETPG